MSTAPASRQQFKVAWFGKGNNTEGIAFLKSHVCNFKYFLNKSFSNWEGTILCGAKQYGSAQYGAKWPIGAEQKQPLLTLLPQSPLLRYHKLCIQQSLCLEKVGNTWGSAHLNINLNTLALDYRWIKKTSWGHFKEQQFLGRIVREMCEWVLNSQVKGIIFSKMISFSFNKLTTIKLWAYWSFSSMTTIYRKNSTNF